MASTLLAPKAISPFIRFCRYAALISGVAYGAYNMKRLTKKEVVIQEHQNRIKTIRAERLRREKEYNTAAEMENLAKEFGITPKV